MIDANHNCRPGFCLALRARFVDQRSNRHGIGGRFRGIIDLLVGIKFLRLDLVILEWDSLSHCIDVLRELLELFDHPPQFIALGGQQEASQHAVNSGATSFAFVAPDLNYSSLFETRRR